VAKPEKDRNVVKVRRTGAYSSFQPVFYLAEECAADQFRHWYQWKSIDE